MTTASTLVSLPRRSTRASRCTKSLAGRRSWYRFSGAMLPTTVAPVLVGQALGFLAAITVFFDQHADQVDIGGQAIHVLRYFVRSGGQYVTVAQGQPGGIAGAWAVLQPERAALVVGAVQAQAQVFPFALDLVWRVSPLRPVSVVALRCPVRVRSGTSPGAGFAAGRRSVSGFPGAAVQALRQLRRQTKRTT